MSNTKLKLKLENATKVFNEGKESEVQAVKHADITIYEGEMVALMGPSGSGKSTLLNIIGGLTPISSGTI